MTRRCAGCYLPMQWSFRCDWFTCWLCGPSATVTGVTLANRGRLRRLLDRVTGMDS